MEHRYLLAAIDADGLFEVELGQVAQIGGHAFSDQNLNRVRDHQQSDGRLGVALFGDRPSTDWSLQSLNSVVDAQGDTAYVGDFGIGVQTASAGASGIQFAYTGGESFSTSGLTHVRLFARSEMPSTTLRIRLVGDTGLASSLGQIPVLEQAWGEIDIPFSSFTAPHPFSSLGELTSVQFTFSQDVEVSIDEVGLLGSVAVSDPQPVTGLPNWGTNLFSHEDYTADAAFADVTRTFRRWGQLDAPWLVDPELTYSDQGVPLQPAGAVIYLLGYDPGIFQLRYEGTGTIDFAIAPGETGSIEVVPDSLRNEGSETVADVQVTHPGALMFVRIESVDSADPIRNLRLLAPGYHGASPPTFRDEFLNRLQPFSTLRFMDYSVTNNSTVTDWSLRRLPSDLIQTSQLTSGDRGGVAWELLIEMANAAQTDAWINIPHLADDNYVQQLATLWRDQLDPNLDLIVEFSNELWNPAFAQYQTPVATYYEDVLAETLFRMRQTFDQIWGADQERVKIVLAGQAANQFPIRQAFARIDSIIQNPPAEFVGHGYQAVSEVIHAVGVAVYANVDGIDRYSNLNDTMVSLLDMTEERAHMELLRELADQYSVQMYGYEGGQHLRSSQTTYPELVLLAQNDPRMATVQASLSRLWQEFGGDLFMHYTFTGASGNTSQWGLLQSLDLPGSVRWDSALSLLRMPGDANLDGTVDYLDFEQMEPSFASPDPVWWEAGDFDANGWVDQKDLWQFWANLDDRNGLTPEQLAAINSKASISLPAEIESLSLSFDQTAIVEENLPASGHLAAAQLTIQRSGDTTAPVWVDLRISDEGELALASKRVQIPAGQDQVSLSAFAVNDGQIDSRQLASVLAEAIGYASADAAVFVDDVGVGQLETFLSGVLVYLDGNDNAVFDAGELAVLTDAAGRFHFDVVPPGQYRARVHGGGAGDVAVFDREQWLVDQPFDDAQQVNGIGTTAAWELDGKDDRVQRETTAELAWGSSSTRTVSLWFYAYDTTHRQVLYEEGNADNGLNLYLENGQLWAGAWNVAAINQPNWSGTWLTTTPGTIQDHQWHHMTLVLDGANEFIPTALTGYLDGVQFATGNGTQLTDRANSVSLGAADSSTRFAVAPSPVVAPANYEFVGFLDQLVIDAEPWSAAEILAHANQSLTNPPPEENRVMMSALDAVATEGTADTGQFVFTLTTPRNQPTTIEVGLQATADPSEYVLWESDGTVFDGTMVIPAFASSATITLVPNDDLVVELEETISLQIDNVLDGVLVGGRDSGTVQLADNDVATVSIGGGATATEGGNVALTVSMTRESSVDTTIELSVTGDTVETEYGLTPMGAVTIPAGQVTATVDVNLADDTLVEGDESLFVSLTSVLAGVATVGLNSTPTEIVILDNDTGSVSLQTVDGQAAESNDPGQFAVQLSHASSTATTVGLSYMGSSVPDADYLALPAEVTVPAGETTVTVAVVPIADTDVEGPEQLFIQISGITAGDPDMSIDSESSQSQIDFAADLPVVVGRHLFYHDSFYDQIDPANPLLHPNDRARAPSPTESVDSNHGKAALRPGESASFVNYSTFSRGLNGIMVDVARLSSDPIMSLDNFSFSVGVTNDFNNWIPAPEPVSFTTRQGQGLNGSDRYTFTWPDHVIENVWLSVRTHSDANVNVVPDQFFFGSLVGDTGNAATTSAATTDYADVQAVFRETFQASSITSPMDLNRDGFINSLDVQVVFSNVFGELPLITPSDGSLAAIAASLQAIMTDTTVTRDRFSVHRNERFSIQSLDEVFELSAALTGRIQAGQYGSRRS